MKEEAAQEMTSHGVGMPEDYHEHIARGSYVLISSNEGGAAFLGQVGGVPSCSRKVWRALGGQAGSSAVRSTGRENWRSQQPGTARKRTGNTRGFAEIRRAPYVDEVFPGRGGPTPISSRNSPKRASQNCGRGLGFGAFSGAGAPSWGRLDVCGRLWSC